MAKDKPDTSIESADASDNGDLFTEDESDDSGEMKRTTVYLPEELHQRVRIYSVTSGESMAEHIRTALELYLDQNGA